MTVRYQRRTPLLQLVVEAVGGLLAGRGGARMLRILHVTLSRCTVLSQLMRMPLVSLQTPRVLGVDDFALYGDTYGTLLIDATTRIPLTLWEGRDAEQLSSWLRAHPGVETICRDGSLTYRQGIADSASDAVQVSDKEGCEAGAVAAGSFECPAAAARDMRAGEVERALVAAAVGRCVGGLQDGADGADGCCGDGVAVGVDADDALDVFCKHGHAVVLLRDGWPWAASAWVESPRGGTVMSHAGRRTSC
ncbi:hypothetical protein [Streptomyces sp. NPDC052036]|uniref:hypothetical protein n=1 Tax=Streptomyces sp. NPDC052036 TaxID=3155171 RepID=UPI003439AF57